MDKTGYYEIKQAKDGQYHFNLKASNHEIILSSELYTTKAACQNGIASVQKNSQEESLYQRREAMNGKMYFVLRAKNMQEIGRSEMYDSDAACDNGIASVMKCGDVDKIIDKTDTAAKTKNKKEPAPWYTFRVAQTGDGLYRVGFDAPDGAWMHHSAYTEEVYASEVCDRLNGKG